MRLHFVWIGKTRDRHCAALVADYQQRLRRFAEYEISELKDLSGGGDEKRLVAAEGEKLLAAVQRDDFVVLLDEKGRHMTSAEFAAFIDQRRQQATKRLAFVIGGFAGVSDDVRRRAGLVLSLSAMTMTHELARVALSEQVYRAYTLLEGIPYHRA
ncbi:MAG: 23S rRNA (pseudouridine(1915)-N(3))-methyltransferase RlmH [Blastocatellia bacterium]